MTTTHIERPAIPAPLIEPIVQFMEDNNVERVDIRRDGSEPDIQHEVLSDNAMPESLSRDAGVMVVVRVKPS
jgi:hypothetical protein